MQQLENSVVFVLGKISSVAVSSARNQAGPAD